jgi:hypothetical protein
MLVPVVSRSGRLLESRHVSWEHVGPDVEVFPVGPDHRSPTRVPKVSINYERRAINQ